MLAGVLYVTATTPVEVTWGVRAGKNLDIVIDVIFILGEIGRVASLGLRAEGPYAWACFA